MHLITVLIVVVMVVSLLMARRRGHVVQADVRAAPLFPQTGHERRWFLLLATLVTTRSAAPATPG